MPKTCYLHIGSPKTGSTSIQAWCFRNKAALEGKGLLYPGTQQRHNALLSEFHKHPEELRFNRMGTDLSQDGAARAELTAEYAEAAASSAQAVLYSNENFLGQARQIRLKALQQELAQQFGELRILCYLRDPYKLLVSRAQEQVKSGVRTYEKVVARPPVLSMDTLQDYARVFGKEALVLRNFDKLNAAGTPLLQDCLEAVLPGLSAEEFAPHPCPEYRAQPGGGADHERPEPRARAKGELGRAASAGACAAGHRQHPFRAAAGSGAGGA